MIREKISVEKVLNSRCSCGSETGLKKRHWGTFIDTPSLSYRTNNILDFCKVPQFSAGKLVNWFDNECLFVGFERQNDPFVERILNIESGLQQEAVYLYCAANRLGVCIFNQGINGTIYDEKIATVKFVIKEMVHPYKKQDFSIRAPGPGRDFSRGLNLIEPMRDGEVDCLPEMQRLELYSNKGSQATDNDLSQLLWAAKGRTPHLIRLQVLKMMWGLTIPTWAGGQDYTSVHIIHDRKNYQYINLTKGFLPKSLVPDKLNWIQGNPTHDTKQISKIDAKPLMDGFENAIVLCQNEKTNRALWEVGYMLENMFLQIRSLGISFSSKIFKDPEIAQLTSKGLPNAVAALLL
jgi:hypothetical protein